MEIFQAHPIALILALIATVIWTMGNYQKNKVYVIIGIVLTVAAVVAFVLERGGI